MSKTQHQKRVEALMKKARQEVPDSVKLPSENVLKLRASLILEEALETIRALGVTVLNRSGGDSVTDCAMSDFFLSCDPSRADLVEIADGCADLSVVTTGTLSACGIDDKELLQEVDKNNLAKFGPGHSYREDGKLIKPPNHQKPNIAAIIYKKEKA